MALVIEDGTVVTGANSYIDIPEAKAFAAARGVDLGNDDVVTEQRLLIAMDYLESLNYKGVRTEPDEQLLSWPRTGVTFDGRTFGDRVIPNQLKSAQAQLAIEQFNGVSIFASSSASNGAGELAVKKEVVDVIETEFFSPKDMGQEILAVAQMPAVSALLRGLLKGFGPLFAYRG